VHDSPAFAGARQVTAPVPSPTQRVPGRQTGWKLPVIWQLSPASALAAHTGVEWPSVQRQSTIFPATSAQSS
jgi:hypothetical protein